MTIEEYRSHFRNGDCKFIAELSKKQGMNNGKGYSLSYVYSVINGLSRDNKIKYENSQIIDLFKGVIQNRLINEFLELQKDTGQYAAIENFNSAKEAAWETVVKFYQENK